MIAIYVGVRGWENYFELNQGYNFIPEDGTLMWGLQLSDVHHQYIVNLKKDVDPDRVAQVFDELMARTIQAKTTK